MLKGILLKEEASDALEKQVPEIVYDDESIIVLNKPAGMLSVPGKKEAYSVQSWLQGEYSDYPAVLLAHRLDMATSGLLVAAKTRWIHKQLQRQFIKREVKKRYAAILSKPVEVNEVTINLPLRVDLDDRPRQLVCYQHGKTAVTRVKVIKTDGHFSRVNLYPVTGRTHQLRVHMAHELGMSAPIVGDELYGNGAERLLLHAEFLSFRHPLNGKEIQFKAPAPF
jgi:tRNA pseudouridine32 synthase/23S rRNA pseudouridine746 synthase